MSLSKTKFLRRTALSVSLLALCSAAHAGAVASPGWDEAVNGDLSNVGPTPTLVTLLEGGVTTIVGTTGASSANVVDLDYFTFTVPAGFELSSLTVLDGTMPIGSNGFIGVMSGTSFTVLPDSFSAVGLLGFALYGENDIGTDILPTMGLAGIGATGFTPPLPAGDYSFWVQETGMGVATYGFAFGVTAVPEPATALSLLAGLALLAGALKRR